MAKTRNSVAFTLIELLVVVVIILILAALFLPTLKSAQASAKSVQCMNNLRKIGQAAQLFANDNNGFYRPGYVVDGKPPVYVYYLLPYCGMSDLSQWIYRVPSIFICPACREGLKNFNTGNGQPGYIGSYMMNAEVSQPSRPLAAYKNPGRQIFYFDSNTAGHAHNTAVKNLHGGFANYLFLDGHVEAWRDPGPMWPNDTKVGWRIIQ